MKRKFLVAAVTILVFLILFWYIEFDKLVEVLFSVKIFWFLTGFLVTSPFLFLASGRWQGILKSAGYNIPFKKCFMIIISVWPFSTVSPSRSGDLLRSYGLRYEVPLSTSIGSVILEKAIDFFSLSLLLVSGSIALGSFKIAWLVIVVLATIIPVLLFFRKKIGQHLNDTWRRRLEEFEATFKTLRERKDLFLMVLAYSLINWILTIVLTKILFLSVGVNVPIFVILAKLPLAIFVGLIPITIAGMGTRDSALIALFASFAEPSQALTVGLLYSFFSYWLFAFIGLPFSYKFFQKEKS